MKLCNSISMQRWETCGAKYAPESLAQELRQRPGNLGTGTPYIEPGSPWENGYCESVKGGMARCDVP